MPGFPRFLDAVLVDVPSNAFAVGLELGIASVHVSGEGTVVHERDRTVVKRVSVPLGDFALRSVTIVAHVNEPVSVVLRYVLLVLGVGE